jgi:hypothetical protein
VPGEDGRENQLSGDPGRRSTLIGHHRKPFWTPYLPAACAPSSPGSGRWLAPSLGGALPREAAICYPARMENSTPLIKDDEDAAEAQVLAAAIAEADTDPRTAPHEEVRAWLLRIANDEFDAPPPKPR